MSEIVTIVTDPETAKNMIVFMSRAQLQGTEAEAFLKCKSDILVGIQESQKPPVKKKTRGKGKPKVDPEIEVDPETDINATE